MLWIGTLNFDSDMVVHIDLVDINVARILLYRGVARGSWKLKCFIAVKQSSFRITDTECGFVGLLAAFFDFYALTGNLIITAIT